LRRPSLRTVPGSEFKPSAECSNKAIRFGCLRECGAESDPAVQNAHSVQVGFPNTLTVEPASDLSEVISDGEITGACNLNTPHGANPSGFIADGSMAGQASIRLSHQR
jgi:hypothetical protein